MSELYIRGGSPLSGAVTVQGAKNCVLPVLAACLLVPGPVELCNCPRLTDVTAALDILRLLGCRAQQCGHRITVDASGAFGTAVPEERMRAMRSSILFLGPLLARMGEASMGYPGGCELGPRPIDLHLAAIRALGCTVEETGGGLVCTGRPEGGEIDLPIPSVGATENAMLCAVGGSGVTTITNAAREPEIAALQDFLNTMGAHVRGGGSGVITVAGGRPLHGGAWAVMGDRIVAATLLCAAAAAGGRAEVRGVERAWLIPVLETFRRAGCRVDSGETYVALSRDPDRPLRAAPTVRTAPYPGFPTDAQAPVMAALCTAAGSTVFVENLFDSRYRHVEELRRMGADITTEGRVAVVRGVERLRGAQVTARDLRGGGALAVAALAAEGESVLSGVEHIDRGYETIEAMLSGLGGDVRRA